MQSFERLLLYGTLLPCGSWFCVEVEFYMEINQILESLGHHFMLNYSQYLSVSLGSLSNITIHVIMCSIQGSLLLTGFTPQIAMEKQVK